jgi:type II restriction enzyme
MQMEMLSQLLSDNCKKIRDEKGWTSTSRIIGEATEDCVITIPCPICSDKALVKYKTNQKSKDVKCEKCSCQIQIKAIKHTKKQLTSLKLLGAEYKTTCSSIKENNVHYLVLMYSVVGDKYNINDIYFIDHADINESCIIPRTPLSSTAKRAGWQGCMLVFNKFKSVKLPV